MVHVSLIKNCLVFFLRGKSHENCLSFLSSGDASCFFEITTLCASDRLDIRESSPYLHTYHAHTYAHTYKRVYRESLSRQNMHSEYLLSCYVVQPRQRFSGFIFVSTFRLDNRFIFVQESREGPLFSLAVKFNEMKIVHSKQTCFSFRNNIGHFPGRIWSFSSLSLCL